MQVTSGPWSLFHMVNLVQLTLCRRLSLCSPSPYTSTHLDKKFFSYFSTKTYVVGTQKNRLNETALLST